VPEDNRAGRRSVADDGFAVPEFDRYSTMIVGHDQLEDIMCRDTGRIMEMFGHTAVI
jgi:hypothetical protein